MKTKYLKEITALGLTAVLFFGSCLKDDKHLFQPLSVQSNLAELPLSGLSNFTRDAITGPGIDTVTFAVGVTAATPPSTATTVVIGVDNALIAPYNAANPAIAYQPVPTAAFKLPVTSVSIPAGQNSTRVTVIIDRNQLDPSLSYMLPVKIVSAPVPISANFGVHYFHIIGNDFAGNYLWDYRRYNNGTGPGAGVIPSQGGGPAPDAGSFIGQPGKVEPISPTEIQMLTGYNNSDVRYDLTFTRTATGGTVSYTNWAVKFDAANIAKYTTLGLVVMVAPKFTIPPPATSTAPKIFEMNHTTGAAAGRYIDDTYRK